MVSKYILYISLIMSTELKPTAISYIFSIKPLAKRNCLENN